MEERFPEIKQFAEGLTIDELRYACGCVCGELLNKAILSPDDVEKIGDIVETAHETKAN